MAQTNDADRPTGDEPTGPVQPTHPEPAPEHTSPQGTSPQHSSPQGTSPEPTEAELAAMAEPARTRRAPRIKAFLWVGALVGGLLGLLAAFIAGPSSGLVADGTAFVSILEGQGAIRLISALAGAVLGALVGGLLALRADRRSIRRADSPD